MKFLPTPPTDNLYKFSAISGLLSCLLSIFGIIYFMYLGVHFDNAGKLQVHSYSAQKTLDEVNCRLDAIKKGELEKCLRDTDLVQDGSDKEIAILKHIQKVQKSTVDDYKKHTDISRPLSENIEWVVEKNIHWVILSIPVLSLFLFVFGFANWYRKVQKPADKLLNLNVKIKELESSPMISEMTELSLAVKKLEKLKLETELAKLQKPERKNFSRRQI